MNAADTEELPEGWARAALCELVKPSSEKVEPSEWPEATYLSLEHIEPQTSAILGRGRGSDVNSTKAVFHAGDVLYGKLRPYLNKVVVPDFDGICSTDILVFRPQPWLDPRFLKYFLSTPAVVEFANHNSTGVQLPRIGFGALGTLELSLPPLAEQRRIVAAVEAVLAKVNAARERLNRVPAILKRFRQAVLSAACSGRLTADWRKQNPDATPCAEDGEDGTLELPEHWKWVRFGKLIASLRSGSNVPPSNGETEFPILRSSSVRQGFVDLHDVKYLDAADSENEINFLAEGDLLFTRLSGSLEFVGNCARVPALKGQRIQYPDRLFCAKLKEPRCAGYLVCVFGVPFIRDEMTEGAKSSAGHQRISMGNITSQRVPVPPLAEQQEIVRQVDKLFALADVIEARLTDARRMAHQLTQAVLAKAFRGELVPTEAALARREKRTYEPASELLARIRAERDQPAAPTRPQPDRTHRSAQPAAPKPPRDIKTVRLHRALVLAYFTDRQPQPNRLNRTRAIKHAAFMQWQFGTALALVPVRGERGPYDKAIEDIETDAEKAGFIETYKKPKDGDGFAVRYRPGPKSAAACKKARALFGEALPAVDEFLDRMFEMKTDDVELFGTVYAAWNDLLLDNRPADNAAILAEVHGWHASKRDKFPKAAVHAMLARIREWGYTPTGTAPRTRRE